jgi:hypothetical protein
LLGIPFALNPDQEARSITGERQRWRASEHDDQPDATAISGSLGAGSPAEASCLMTGSPAPIPASLASTL